MPQADWIEVVAIWRLLEDKKLKFTFFERANHSGFATWEFTAKEKLNPRKQVFLVNFRLWPDEKPKIFYGNMFI